VLSLNLRKEVMHMKRNLVAKILRFAIIFAIVLEIITRIGGYVN